MLMNILASSICETIPTLMDGSSLLLPVPSSPSSRSPDPSPSHSPPPTPLPRGHGASAGAVLVASVILFTNRARVLFLARHTKSAHCSIDLLQCALFCVTLSTVILSLAVRVNLMVCVLTKPQVVHDHSFQPTKIWTRRFWECERGVTGWLESWRCLPPPWAWA